MCAKASLVRLPTFLLRSSTNLRYTSRIIEASSLLLYKSTARTMATLGVHGKKHKVTVVGSGNWYALHLYAPSW